MQKRICALLLALALPALCHIAALAESDSCASEPPASASQATSDEGCDSGAASSEPPASASQATPDEGCDSGAVSSEPPERQTENGAPTLSLKIRHLATGWVVAVGCDEFPFASQDSVLTWYSFDGEHFEPVLDVNGQTANWGNGEKPFIFSTCEPLKSLVEESCDSFYLYAQLEGQNFSGRTATAMLNRSPEPVPLPENAVLMARLEQSMVEKLNTRPISYKGVYKVSVQEGLTGEEFAAALPSTIPVEVQLHIGGAYETARFVDYGIGWKLPDSLPETISAGDSFTFPADTLTPPDSFVISSPLKKYLCGAPPPPGYWTPAGDTPYPIELQVSVVPGDVTPPPPPILTPGDVIGSSGGGGNRGDAGSGKDDSNGQRLKPPSGNEPSLPSLLLSVEAAPAKPAEPTQSPPQEPDMPAAGDSASAAPEISSSTAERSSEAPAPASVSPSDEHPDEDAATAMKPVRTPKDSGASPGAAVTFLAAAAAVGAGAIIFARRKT